MDLILLLMVIRSSFHISTRAGSLKIFAASRGPTLIQLVSLSEDLQKESYASRNIPYDGGVEISPR